MVIGFGYPQMGDPIYLVTSISNAQRRIFLSPVDQPPEKENMNFDIWSCIIQTSI